jgi:hypothetical protein
MRFAAIKRSLTAGVMGLLLMLPGTGYAQKVEENPGAMTMIGDLVIARPVLIATTVVGAAAYVVSLPFTLAGGNAKEAGETLVTEPAKNAFVRCLGCRQAGYNKSDVK